MMKSSRIISNIMTPKHMYEFEIIRKLEEIYWLINDDKQEMERAEKPIVLELNKARDIIAELLSFFEENKNGVLCVSTITEDLQYEVSRINEVVDKLSDVKVITV